METLIKTVIENLGSIGIGGSLLIVILVMFWQNIKREERSNDSYTTMHKQTTGALSDHATANSEIARAMEKQAASVIELSTLIKFGAKDK